MKTHVNHTSKEVIQEDVVEKDGVSRAEGLLEPGDAVTMYDSIDNFHSMYISRSNPMYHSSKQYMT